MDLSGIGEIIRNIASSLSEYTSTFHQFYQFLQNAKQALTITYKYIQSLPAYMVPVVGTLAVCSLIYFITGR